MKFSGTTIDIGVIVLTAVLLNVVLWLVLGQYYGLGLLFVGYPGIIVVGRWLAVRRVRRDEEGAPQ